MIKQCCPTYALPPSRNQLLPEKAMDWMCFNFCMNVENIIKLKDVKEKYHMVNYRFVYWPFFGKETMKFLVFGAKFNFITRKIK